MRILGLDISSVAVGWGIIQDSPPFYLVSGTLPLLKKEHMAHHEGRLHLFSNLFNIFLENLPPIDYCVVEDLVKKMNKNSGMDQLITLSMYWTLGLEALQRNRVLYKLQAPITTKSLFQIKNTKGGKPKIEIHAKLKKMIPVLQHTNNEDELDAIALAVSQIIPSANKH